MRRCPSPTLFPLGGRGFLLPVVFLISAQASALPEFLETFKKTYPLKADSKIAGTECNICHAGPPKRNVYGKSVQEAGHNKVTAAILHSIDAKDSDGDGWTNGEEIRAGTLPGDPNSHPAGAKKPAVPPPAGDLIPKHSGHPLLIHFPIALFLFGAFLDRLGVRQFDDGLRRGAVITMWAGASTALVAATTGVIAALRLGYALTPGQPVFTHLVFGVLSTVAMLGAVARRRRSPDSVATLVLILVAAVLVIAAGHFGGSLVYDR
ncbi:hypothetical protein BH11ARM2_BH11ARM2_17420 [soil metagenome]